MVEPGRHGHACQVGGGRYHGCVCAKINAVRVTGVDKEACDAGTAVPHPARRGGALRGGRRPAARGEAPRMALHCLTWQSGLGC